MQYFLRKFPVFCLFGLPLSITRLPIKPSKAAFSENLAQNIGVPKEVSSLLPVLVCDCPLRHGYRGLELCVVQWAIAKNQTESFSGSVTEICTEVPCTISSLSSVLDGTSPSHDFHRQPKQSLSQRASTLQRKNFLSGSSISTEVTVVAVLVLSES